MIDTIIVVAIVIIAGFFVGRRILKPFLSKETACGCSGCGKAGSCTSIKTSPDESDCCGTR